MLAATKSSLGQPAAKSQPPENVVKEIRSDQVPFLDESSLKFLRKITRNDLTQLEFDDTLKIYSLSGNEIGDFRIKVKPTVHKRVDCFKIEAKSVGVLDDAPCGTEIVAYVNEDLETIDQQYHEYIKLPTGKLDRKTTIIMEKDDYFIHKNEANGNEITKTSFKVRKNLMEGFISESSNILLQRLMVQYNKYESVTLFTFDSDMNPCLVSYKPLDNRIVSIEDEGIKVRGIERFIESISDVPTTWQIYFSPDGHMINRVQIGYPAVMKVATVPSAIAVDQYLKKPVIEKKELNWEKDMELKSKYLDRKEEHKNEYDQYMFDHPDLRALMADFTQSILSFKPEDTIAFSSKFFASYSAKTRAGKFLPEYRDKVNTPKH